MREHEGIIRHLLWFAISGAAIDVTVGVAVSVTQPLRKHFIATTQFELPAPYAMLLLGAVFSFLTVVAASLVLVFVLPRGQQVEAVWRPALLQTWELAVRNHDPK